MEWRPPDEAAIERLAAARFDGDMQAASRAVLETGLEHTPIPDRPRPSLETDDRTRRQYTDANTQRIPCLAARFVPSQPTQLRVITTTATDQYSRPMAQFLATLALVCRYDGVDHERLAWTIADRTGNWFGWGVDTVATALREPRARYREVGRAPAEAETVELLLPIENATVHLTLTHEIQNGDCRLTGFECYAPGEPVGYRPRLQAIAAQFDRRLQTARPVATAATASVAYPVEPAGYLTDPDDEWVTKLLIDCSPALIPDVDDTAALATLPAQCVVWLTDHAPADVATDYRWQVETVRALRLENGTWNLGLSGTWDDQDAD